jgi:predicted ribosomally synthesized peptide with SipW-like signal peptide
MSRNHLKKYLLLLIAIGVIAVGLTGSGTFASFSAETTNPNGTFASGTLFLHDTPNGGTVCTSESATSGTVNVNPGDGSNGNNCAALFTANLSNGAATATLALKNAGTINSSDLELSVPSCGWGDNFAVTGSHVTFITPPSNCNGVYFTVQETGSSYSVPSSDVYCALGPSTSQPDCDAPNNTRTLGGTSALTQLLTTSAANATLTAGQTRYYVIKVDPSGVGSGNQLQNLKLTFAMTFHIDQ